MVEKIAELADSCVGTDIDMQIDGFDLDEFRQELGKLLQSPRTVTREFYLLVVHDRHTDDSHYLYGSRKEAIYNARKLAYEYCKFPEDYEEKKIEGWEFYANYSCESDYVKVVKLKELGIEVEK